MTSVSPGVFLETDLSFSLGAPISLCLVPEHVDPNGPLRIHCQGDIVRVEDRSKTVGIAVAVASHRLDPSGPLRSWDFPKGEETP